MRPVTKSRRSLGVLTIFGLGLILAMVAGPGTASADEVPYGDDTVTVSVYISELDLCERGLPGCKPDGLLGMTGSGPAVPIGLGALLLVPSLAVLYALVLRGRFDEAPEAEPGSESRRPIAPLRELPLLPAAGLCLVVGVAAIDAVTRGDTGMMVALRGTEVLTVPLADALAEPKLLDPELFETAEVFFG